MKTIRKNTFETNSSSTHSITIGTKGEYSKSSPSVENNILYPSRLATYKISYGESRFLIANTKDTKAALLADWVLDMFDNESYSEYIKTFSDQSEDEIKQYHYDIIAKLCGYDSIDMEGKSWGNFSSSTEWDTFGPFYSEEEFLDFIKNIVLDDKKEIIDSVTPQY